MAGAGSNHLLYQQGFQPTDNLYFRLQEGLQRARYGDFMAALVLHTTVILEQANLIRELLQDSRAMFNKVIENSQAIKSLESKTTALERQFLEQNLNFRDIPNCPPPSAPAACNIYPQVGEQSVHIMCGPARGDQPPLLSLARMTQSQRIESVYPYQRPSVLNRPPPRPPDGYPNIPPNFIPHPQSITQYAFQNNPSVFPSQRPFGIVTHGPRMFPPPTTVQTTSTRLPLMAPSDSANGNLSVANHSTPSGSVTATSNIITNVNASVADLSIESQNLPTSFPHLVLPEGITIIPLGPAKMVEKAKQIREPLSKTLQPSVVIEAIEDQGKSPNVQKDLNFNHCVTSSSRKRLSNSTEVDNQHLEVIPYVTPTSNVLEGNVIELTPSIEEAGPPVKKSTQKGLNLDRLLQKITELNQNRPVIDTPTTSVSTTSTTSSVSVPVGSRRRKSLSKPVREKPRQHIVETIYEEDGEYEEEYPEIAEIAFRNAALSEFRDGDGDIDGGENEQNLPVIVSVKGSTDVDDITTTESDDTQHVAEENINDDEREYLKTIEFVVQANGGEGKSGAHETEEAGESVDNTVDANLSEIACDLMNSKSTTKDDGNCTEIESLLTEESNREDAQMEDTLDAIKNDNSVKNLIDDIVENVNHFSIRDEDENTVCVNDSVTSDAACEKSISETQTEVIENTVTQKDVGSEVSLVMTNSDKNISNGARLNETSQVVKRRRKRNFTQKKISKMPKLPRRRSQRKKTSIENGGSECDLNCVKEDKVEDIQKKESSVEELNDILEVVNGEEIAVPDNKSNAIKIKNKIPAKKNKFSIWSSMGYRTRKKKRKSRLKTTVTSAETNENPSLDESKKTSSKKNCREKSRKSRQNTPFWTPLYRKSIRLNKIKKTDILELESVPEKSVNTTNDANHFSTPTDVGGDKSVIETSISPVILVGKVTRSMQSQLDALSSTKSVISDLSSTSSKGNEGIDGNGKDKSKKRKSGKNWTKNRKKTVDKQSNGCGDEEISFTQNILTRSDALTAVSALENVEVFPSDVRNVVQDLVEITHLREQVEVEDAILSDGLLNGQGLHGSARAATLTRAIRIWQEHDYSRFPIEVLKSTDEVDDSMVQEEPFLTDVGDDNQEIASKCSVDNISEPVLPSTSSLKTKIKGSRRVAKKSVCSSCRDCSSLMNIAQACSSSSNFVSQESSISAQSELVMNNVSGNNVVDINKDGKNVDSGENLKHLIRSKLQTKLRSETSNSSAADSEDDYACLLKTFIQKRSVLSEKNTIVPPTSEQNVNIKTIKHRLSFAIAEGLVTTFAEDDEASSLQPQVQCVNIFSIHEIWKYLKSFINDSTRTVLALHQLGQKEIQQFLVLARLCLLDAHQDDNDLYFEKAEHTEDLTVEMLEKAIKVLEESNNEVE